MKLSLYTFYPTEEGGCAFLTERRVNSLTGAIHFEGYVRDMPLIGEVTLPITWNEAGEVPGFENVYHPWNIHFKSTATQPKSKDCLICGLPYLTAVGHCAACQAHQAVR